VGEKLHAVAAVREAETKAAAADAARPATGAPPATALLDAAIRRAGAQCTPQVGSST